MTDNEIKHPRRIKSFVLRCGRLTAGQQRGLDENWDRWGLTLEQGALNQERVFGRTAPLVLEIGYGMGLSLVEMAAAAPEKDFIGVEVHRPGVGSLLAEASVQGLTNLRSYCEDAIKVLEQCVADGSLDRVQLFFPDPWHKKRHHKRRIVKSEFVQLLRRKLKVGGQFHMATDWENYAEHMLEVMSDAAGYRNLAGEQQYMPRPDYRPLTKFEKRGQRLGHGVWDLVFERVD